MMATPHALPVLPERRVDPGGVTLMVKPVGGSCNLRCGYCYYLPTLEQYGGRTRRMSLDTLAALFAGWLPRVGDEVVVAWQGGEPMLAGLDFFRAAMQLQARHSRSNQRIQNALQTNGTLLDDAWCRFLREHDFLVGLSIDGCRPMHDGYRVDALDRPTFHLVREALRRLRRHGVEHNLLCVLTDRNVGHPKALWQAMVALDERWLQFIPAIEWVPDGDGFRLAPFSPTAEQYGRFLCETFDLWFEGHRETISVRDFDAWLSVLVIGQPTLCQYAGSCHHQLTVEHNGDVYGCDHFVDPAWRLGRIEPGDDRWLDRLNGETLGDFAAMKSRLPDECERCPWRALCHGGCTKHRGSRGRVAERSVLCDGYRMFFEHAMLRLEWLAAHLRAGDAVNG